MQVVNWLGVLRLWYSLPNAGGMDLLLIRELHFIFVCIPLPSLAPAEPGRKGTPGQVVAKLLPSLSVQN